MKQRSIIMLAYEGIQILDVTGPLQMFAGVNDEVGASAYHIEIAAAEAGPFAASSGLRICADLALADIDTAKLERTDTLLAAGGDAGLRAALADGRITDILARAKGHVRRIASVCSGAFFLAAAGLLDGRRAATHWDAIARLRRFRPQVEVDGDAIHICDGDLWTSAGVTAGIDLALAMIEEDFGRDMALAIARRHVVYRIRTGGQSQFSAELAGQSAADRRIARVAESVLAEPSADWNVERLAHAGGLSLRTLSRLCRRELQASPAAFVERVRIDAARKALIETGASIEDIACQCGFGSLRRMDRAFARTLSVSPSEFRNLFRAKGDRSWPSQSASSSSPISPSSI
jgi:transcriptional regulator GlxA family with amidase domain